MENLLANIPASAEDLKLYIKYDPDNARMLLCNNKHIRHLIRVESELHYRCNGLVVDVAKQKVISNPPYGFVSMPNHAKVNVGIAAGEYDLIKVSDGTVLTLYNWRGMWCLSSSNGYDVSTLKLTGVLTFAEMVYDLCRRLYPESQMSLVDGRLTSPVLDSSKSYSFGFRHHSIHPLLVDPERIWQIQWCGDDAVPHFSGGVAGLPWQQTFINFTNLMADPFRSINGLRGLCINAYDRAVRCIRAGGEIHWKTLLYGFILRHKVTNMCILIESDLLEYVRNVVYHRIPQIEDICKQEYNVMRTFLLTTDRDKVLALYPNWAPYFAKYTHFINELVGMILSINRASAGLLSGVKCESQLGQLAKKLYAHISKYENLSQPLNANSESIVRDFITLPDYTEVYLKACAHN